MNTDGITSAENTEYDDVDVVFRPQKSSRSEVIFSLIISSLLGISFPCIMWFVAHPCQKWNAVLIFSAIGAILPGLCIWLILVSKLTSITIRKGTVILQSVFSRKELELSNITQARWKLISQGALRLETPTESGTLGLINLTSNERLWLIQYFRNRLPESIQQNWDLFCLKIALPLREPKPEANRDPGPDEILVTRKRYDRLGIPLIIFSIICVALTAWYFRSPQYLVFPLILIGLWLLLRFSVPKEGMVSSRISADKEYMQTLFFLAWWIGAGLFGFSAFVLADLPPSFPSGVGWCMTILWTSVGCWKVHQSNRVQHNRDLEKAKAAAQKWQDQP